MKTEQYLLNGLDGTSIPVTLWMPDGSGRMILQIVHGMTEYIGRYEELAEELTVQNIIVAGFDLRGHGKNKGNATCASLGENGWEQSLNEIHLLNNDLSRQFPDLPVVMMGFSLGSFLLRDYLSCSKDPVAAAIIMGTGTQPSGILSILKKIVKSQIKKSGFNETTPLVRKLSFETYNAKFKPNQSSLDWLCSDRKEMEKYSIDPLCQKDISSGLFWQLLDGMQRTGKKDVYDNWKKEFPVLLISGQDDPVGNFGKGVCTVASKMKKSGLTNVKTVLISNGRHDILHEHSNGGSKKTIEEIKLFLKLA